MQHWASRSSSQGFIDTTGFAAQAHIQLIDLWLRQYLRWQQFAVCTTVGARRRKKQDARASQHLNSEFVGRCPDHMHPMPLPSLPRSCVRVTSPVVKTQQQLLPLAGALSLWRTVDALGSSSRLMPSSVVEQELQEQCKQQLLGHQPPHDDHRPRLCTRGKEGHRRESRDEQKVKMAEEQDGQMACMFDFADISVMK